MIFLWGTHGFIITEFLALTYIPLHVTVVLARNQDYGRDMREQINIEDASAACEGDLETVRKLWRGQIELNADGVDLLPNNGAGERFILAGNDDDVKAILERIALGERVFKLPRS